MAAEQSIPPLITVHGEAEIKVGPDQAVIMLGTRTWNKDLDEARRMNDDRVHMVFKMLSQFQISPSDIQTSYITVEPTYQTRYDKRNNPTETVLTGYRVLKTMSVTLKELSGFEKVLSAVHSGAANQLYGVEFRSSELRKYRDQARAMAIRAAKEKAEALTKEIGQKIGKAHTIDEISISPGTGRMQMQNISQNVSSAGDTGELGESTVAPGKISVRAAVNVSFELK